MQRAELRKEIKIASIGDKNEYERALKILEVKSTNESQNNFQKYFTFKRKEMPKI